MLGDMGGRDLEEMGKVDREMGERDLEGKEGEGRVKGDMEGEEMMHKLRDSPPGAPQQQAKCSKGRTWLSCP